MAFYHNIDDKAQLKKEAHTDPLTKLTNRQYLQDIQSQINLRDYDVIMIDFDHFKRINDTYGHHIGDRVLQTIAKKLQEHTRIDDILVRYGGEEFVYLLYNPLKDINITKKLSERIRLNVQNTQIQYEDLLVTVTVSIGIEAHTERTRNLEEAILHADEMMYFAKRSGRNRIEIYDEIKSLKSRSTKNKYTITEIKEALEEDRLVCHYQPIVNAEREIVKYESLVRLIDKDGSLIKPDTFLPFIKNTNIYLDLTKQVINYNFMFFKGKNDSFTFNLCFSDLLNESIVNIILRKINDYPKISKRLTIELLEDEMIDDFDAIKKVMQKFRQKGVRFAIDDFGSGYANFGNIFKLEFDYLKINGELIRNIDKSEYSRNMIESLSTFAKKAKVKTIAEYVENEQIFESVKKYDIDLYQGYYIGKPLSKLVT
jgi:diguanylate cyclase (GGDEF)-like protein